jgi:ABC-type phosphate transport system substrate-binding protein
MKKHNLGLLILGVLCLSAANASDVIVIGNTGAPSLSKEQISDIFLGKSAASFTPLDQPISASIRAEFYQKVAGKDPTQVKAIWSRLAFSGQGQPPKELADDAAVKKMVASDPKAIGYIDKKNVDSSVKVLLSVD